MKTPVNDGSAELAIIGGGAAGMFAAAVAAERGLRCVLIERKARLGSKVLMTANGRCNFTKDISSDQFLQDLSLPRVAEFLGPALRECPPRSIIKGFQSLKVPLRRMADGRMFPADGKAATIVHAFGDLLRDEEVPIITNCAVRAIRRAGASAVSEIRPHGNVAADLRAARKGQTESAFEIETPSFSFLARNVLLATGGVSYPKTGSVGDGQRFAAELGHRLVPYRPGLIGLETADPRVIRLAGRRFEDDGRVKIFDERGACVFDYRGEVDCERFGLSGAAIYNAQRFLEHLPNRQVDKSTNRRINELSLEVWFGRNRLTFPVSELKPRPVKEAIVTLGGVDIAEIDPRTMESKLVKGLYFAGEVMDVDGPTGGYNLTIAFATARKAVYAL